MYHELTGGIVSQESDDIDDARGLGRQRQFAISLARAENRAGKRRQSLVADGFQRPYVSFERPT